MYKRQGTLYFACYRPNHCQNGHKLAVTVSPPLNSSSSAVAGAATALTIGTAPQFWSPATIEATYSATVGTKLVFRYAAHHNVYIMPSKEAYDDCDFSRATKLAARDHGGGGGGDVLPNLYQAVAIAAGSLYFACGSPNHCESGHKTTVTVSLPLDASSSAVADAATELEVGKAPQFWSQVPSTPNAYSVAVGTKLVFRYDTYHNLYLLPSMAALDNCDFSEATQLAGEGQGGGEGDNPPNLYEAVTVATGTLYLACQKSTHCRMGHRIKITVVSRRERLDSSPAALGGFHIEQQIGLADPDPRFESFWSRYPSSPNTYSVVVLSLIHI